MSGGSGRPHVVVIGTGVAGAATGFALARRGAAVTFVEADLPGRATSAGAGIIQPWSTSAGEEFCRLYSAAADYYPEALAHLAEAGVTEVGFRRSGALVVNRDAAVLDEVEARIASRAADAATIGEVRRIGGGAARELFPPLADGFEALHISGAARVDGRTLRAGLLAGARQHGATERAGTATLTADGGAEIGGRPLDADAVVVAAGAWTDGLLAPLGVRVGVQPQRGQLVHLRVEGVETRDWPSVHPVAPHYLVAFDGGRVVAGATRETGSGFDARETAAGLRQVLDDALAVAPGLADATLIETRVGLRPLADGELPTVGPLTGHDGLFVNAGFGAGGLTMGPYAGDRLARQVLGVDAA